MKDSIATQLQPIIKPFTQFLWRFHVILFSLLVVGGVAAAIFLLSSSLSISAEKPLVTPESFDKKTMQAISDFQPSNSSVDSFSLPAGRVNPFVE